MAEREWYNIYEVASLLECRPKTVLKLAEKLGWESRTENRMVYFPVLKVQGEAKRRIGERARLQSMGISPLKRIKLSKKEQRRQYMCLRAKIRATKSGIPFNIDMTDIIIPDTCPLLGIPISFGGDRRNIPSLDRIHNNQGYIKGNVWVISNLANMMKQDASIEELKIFAKNILSHFDE